MILTSISILVLVLPWISSGMQTSENDKFINDLFDTGTDLLWNTAANDETLEISEFQSALANCRFVKANQSLEKVRAKLRLLDIIQSMSKAKFECLDEMAMDSHNGQAFMKIMDELGKYQNHDADLSQLSNDEYNWWLCALVKSLKQDLFLQSMIHRGLLSNELFLSAIKTKSNFFLLYLAHFVIHAPQGTLLPHDKHVICGQYFINLFELNPPFQTLKEYVPIFRAFGCDGSRVYQWIGANSKGSLIPSMQSLGLDASADGKVGIIQATRRGDLDTFFAFLQAGIDLSHPAPGEIYGFLLELWKLGTKKEIQAQTINLGQLLSFIAISSNHIPIFEALLPEYQKGFGDYNMRAALSRGSLFLVLQLHALGIKLDIPRYSFYACTQINYPLLEFLIEKGLRFADNDSLCLRKAVQLNDLPVAALLLRDGAVDVNAMSGTPLLISVRNNESEMVDLLLQNGANPFINPAIIQEAKFSLISIQCAFVNIGVPISHFAPLLSRNDCFPMFSEEFMMGSFDDSTAMDWTR